MSTEFVRCPACRSLIPAVSKVCRMCGADLSSGGSRAEEDNARKSGRVRQRTMSQSSEELAQAAHQLRADFTPSAAEASLEEGVADGSSIDPLSAYIEEIDSGAISTTAGSPGLRKAPAENEKRRPANMTSVVSGAEGDVAEAAESAKPRVIVESGARRSGKGSGLSFGKGREDQDSKSSQAKPVEQNRPSRVEPTPNISKEPQTPPQRAAMQLGRMAARESEIVEVENDKLEVSPQVISQGPEFAQESEPAVQSSRGPVRAQHVPLKGGKITAGRLFGWLVSFKDSDGRSIELREGRFFVTRSSVKDADLVIDHESISTPHALMHISADSGLRVHDVISEKGLFIRRRGSEDYQRMAETVEVQHGDYLRFGEVEFQVCLISEVGAK